MGNQNKPTRQHHVPRVYLKNFCAQDGSLTVLDKSRGRIFSSGINVIGAENDFYTLDKLDDPYCWENAYATSIEPLMGELLPQIISRANSWVQTSPCIISAEEKINLAYILVMQLLRGKQARKYEKDRFKEILPDLTERAKEKFGPLSSQQIEALAAFESDLEYFKQISMEIALDRDRITQYSRALVKHKFVFYYICGDAEFVTSDNPFMLVNCETLSADPFSNGLLQESTIGYYPLSSKLLLCIMHLNDPQRDLLVKDGGLYHLSSNSNKTFINTINHKQKDQCYNQVYARNRKSLENL